MNAAAANPRAGVIAERLVRWFAWTSLGMLVTIWLIVTLLGDRVWWTVMLLYGPRWVLAAPWLGVIPWLLVDFRRAAFPALLGLSVAVFGLIDFHVGLHRAATGSGIPLRVLELNANGGGGARLQGLILDELHARKADLVVIAECGPDLGEALKGLTEYHEHTTDGPGLCMLSRGEIVSWQHRDQSDVWKQGGAGYIVRAVVNTAAGPVRVGLVHLATPRNALDSYFSLHQIPLQGPQTWVNINQRDEESRFARDWIMQGENLPTIIAGDFNLPTESAIYKRYWGDFRNAFGRAGFGTGYTKFTRHWGVRIDHILTSNDIGTRESFVGRDVGSDHRPVIADLVLPRR